MLQVVFSCQSVFWITIHICGNIVLFVSVFTSNWLVRIEDKEALSLNCPTQHPTGPVVPRIGPFLRCHEVCKLNTEYPEYCEIYFREQVKSVDTLTMGGVATSALLMTSMIILFVSNIVVASSIAVRDIHGYSIFSLAGILQCLTDLFLFLGLIIWPTGWGTPEVQKVCGGSSVFYNKGKCEIGWGFYLSIVTIILLFVAAIVSNIADRSIQRIKIQRRLLQGETLICEM